MQKPFSCMKHYNAQLKILSGIATIEYHIFPTSAISCAFVQPVHLL